MGTKAKPHPAQQRPSMTQQRVEELRYGLLRGILRSAGREQVQAR